MVWYCIGVNIINRTLHGSLEGLNSSSRIEKIFQKLKRNFVSPCGHVISSPFFFLPMEYRIMLAIDRCTTLTFRFLVASWQKIHLHVVEFSPVFMSVDIYLEYHGMAETEVSKVRPISAHPGETWPFSLPGTWSKVSSIKKETSLKISGKEVDLERNLFHKQHIYHQKSTNIQQSFRLGCRASLYREGLTNVNRNLQEGAF